MTVHTGSFMATHATALGKVAVLMGGSSAEREISLMSGQGVLRALLEAGVDAQAFDPAERELWELRGTGVQRVFIALHGRHGEDGTVQGALELLGIPYTGSGVMASAVAMDKVTTKRLWQAEGLPTPRWLRLSPDELAAAGLLPQEAPEQAASRASPVQAASHPKPALQALCRRVIDEVGLPLIVKPPREGSSIGIAKITAEHELPQALQAAMRFDADVLCEAFINGDELTCPVIGEGPKARAMPVIRIVPPEAGYDYQNKYFTDEVRYLCPSGLAAHVEAEIQRITLAAYRSLGCRGWGRADLMMGRDAATGILQPWLLEMNTSPGMTSHSLVPMSAAAEGMSYGELCIRLLQSARLDQEIRA